jgi:hypothetical protein
LTDTIDSQTGSQKILKRLPCNLEVLTEDLLQNIHQPLLFQSLSSATTFTRGLPSEFHLKKVDIARVLGAVASNGSVTSNETSSWDEELKDGLQICLVSGWIHCDVDGGTTKYAFASLLHQWYVAGYLNGFPDQPLDVSLSEFVMGVIRRFSPRRLSALRNGPGFTHRPPETQYQDEFYRCWFECSRGLLPPPISEISGDYGQVDFFVPTMHWGIELLREGSKIAERCGRFGPGGKYEDFNVNDFIILDFRTTQPVKKFRGKCFAVLYL